MAKDRFREFVRGQTDARAGLPSVHSTDVYKLVDALNTKKLVPPPCDVFPGEQLLYFFYGRPSYRTNADQKSTSLIHYLPVCLLFETNAVSPIKRIFPFDSGGFQTYYSDALHKDMLIEDFGLDTDPSSPGKIISLFYDSVESYLTAHPRASVSLPATEFEAASYHALISNKLSNTRDNRSSGIELQVEGPLNIDGGVRAVILPGPLLDDPLVRSQIKAAGAVGIPYRQIDMQRPSEYVSTIFELCYDYYQKVEITK